MNKKDRDVALTALSDLKSIHQTIGVVAFRAAKCKKNSKLGKQLWKLYDDLQLQGLAASEKISNILLGL